MTQRFIAADVCSGGWSSIHSTERSWRSSFCADAVDFAAVRCCSDLGTGACESICSSSNGYGLPPATNLDPSRASYMQAKTECEAHSLRLCAPDELAWCCEGGCGYDGHHIWTTGPCSKSSSDAPPLTVLVVLAVIAMWLLHQLASYRCWRRQKACIDLGDDDDDDKDRDYDDDDDSPSAGKIDQHHRCPLVPRPTAVIQTKRLPSAVSSSSNAWAGAQSQGGQLEDGTNSRSASGAGSCLVDPHRGPLLRSLSSKFSVSALSYGSQLADGADGESQLVAKGVDLL